MLCVEDPAIRIADLVQLGVDAAPDLYKTTSRAGHHPRVTLLLSWVPEDIVTLRGFPFNRHLLGQSPRLLEQPDIRVDAPDEVSQPLAMRCSYAIEVPSHDAHRRASL